MARVSVAPERWPEVSEAFGLAQAMDPKDRPEYLARTCDDDVGVAVLELLNLSDSAGGFLEEPVFRILQDSDAPPVDVFSAGDLVAGRFRIVTLLGRGGMGEVYEAYDERLGEPIALKAMREDRAGDASATRFLLEAQLARRISHRSVSRVHDIATQTLADGTEVVVLTMELLRGETLADRLRRQPLSGSEIAAIARQIADALDASHTQGVLHGDLKPNNVQLVPEGQHGCRAVLTDFGLATAVGGGLDTSAFGLAGTPAYMAPEQLRGAPISQETDLFSFAVLLHEMCTGQRPSRELDADPGVAVLAPALTSRQRNALRHGLDPDPAARPRTASGLVNALTGEHEWPRRIQGHLRRHGLRWAVVLVVVALAAWSLRLYWRADATIPPSSMVVLTDVINTTSEPELDGATEILRSQLMQSTRFDVLPRAQTAAVLRQMERDPASRLDPAAAREVALRSGAPLVVYAQVSSSASSTYDIHMTMERVGARPSLARARWTKTFPAASRDALFPAFHDAAVWIREMAGEPEADLRTQDRPSSETTTASWDALKLFDRAIGTDGAVQPEQAVLLLRQALQADPDFAMARSRLADILIALRRDQEGLAAWSDALRLLQRTQLTSREHLRIRGQYLEDTGDLTGAEVAYRTYVMHYPNDADAAFFLGSALVDLGRAHEAIQWFERAAQLRPCWFVPVAHLGDALLESGQSARVAEQIATLRRCGATDWAVWLESLSRWATGDVAGSLAALDPVRTSGDAVWRSRAFTIRASWNAELGRLEEARGELIDGIAFDERQGIRERMADKWLHLADICRRLHRGAEDLEFVNKALTISRSPRRLLAGGTVLARGGHLAQADALLQALRLEPDVPINARRINRLEAELLLTRDRAGEAVALLEPTMAADRIHEDRTVFARALLADGHRQRAIDLLRDVLDHPTRLYPGPEPALPAPLADAKRLLAAAITEQRQPHRDRSHDHGGVQ